MNTTGKRVPEGSGWTTRITRVEPNIIEIAGYPLQEIIGRKGLPDVAYLLLHGEFPAPGRSRELTRVAREAARLPLTSMPRLEGERVAGQVVRFLLFDEALASAPVRDEAEWVLFCTGRVVRFLASLLRDGPLTEAGGRDEPFSGMLHRAFLGRRPLDRSVAEVLEALVVATVDHGVTSPSAQAAILAASVRAPLRTAVVTGLGTLTRVHGGAGWEAAELIQGAVRPVNECGAGAARSLRERMEGRVRAGEKIPGAGHRMHDEDPRCAALWALAEEKGVAADCVRCSRMIPGLLSELTGRNLPVNVDGAIGAVIADMGLPLELAEAVFLLGRIAGLAAHCAEEVSRFPEMRWVDFSRARYEGPRTRHLREG